MTPRPTARVYLLPAHDAPVVGVLRRGPSKLWNVLRWDTTNDEITSGSWFRGTLYPDRADISFDGRWMAYDALGSNVDRWAGVCELPMLKTITEWSSNGYGGGGYWRDAETLIVDNGIPKKGPYQPIPFLTDPRLPFDILQEWDSPEIGWKRRARDGWKQIGHDYKSAWIWESQPTPAHPRITMEGYNDPWRFKCPDLLGFFDESVTDVSWDYQGQLLIARAGWLERYTLEDLEHGVPSFRYNLNPLQPKWVQPFPLTDDNSERAKARGPNAD